MNKDKALQSVNEIRELMERSTKFVSLSGLAAILAGIYSLIGFWLAVHLLGSRQLGMNGMQNVIEVNTPMKLKIIVGLAFAVVVASALTAFFLSLYKSRRTKQKLLSKLTLRILWNFAVPLCTGGLFCIALLYHQYYGLTSSVMLLFYGLALINVSKYTFSNVGWLGYAFLLLGIVDSFIQGYALLFWVVGFGGFHIIYGILFYLLYERKN